MFYGMQTKVMECKSHNTAIHLSSNGANDDVSYLRRAADRVCLGNVELPTQGGPAGVVAWGEGGWEPSWYCPAAVKLSCTQTSWTSPLLLHSHPETPSFGGIPRTF